MLLYKMIIKYINIRSKMEVCDGIKHTEHGGSRMPVTRDRAFYPSYARLRP